MAHIRSLREDNVSVVSICQSVHGGGPHVISHTEPPCYDLTLQADSRQIPNLEHLYIIEVIMQANATIIFKDCRAHFDRKDAFTV